jgi:hypothetical protein
MKSAPPSVDSPSDVYLIAIFDTTDRLVRPYREDIFATNIDAYTLHLNAQRKVNVLLSDRTMQTWDSLFLENLAELRDTPLCTWVSCRSTRCLTACSRDS